MGAIRPAFDPCRRRARIAIGNADERKSGKAIIKYDGDLLLDPLPGPTQDMTRAAAMRVLHGFAALIEELEAIDTLAVREPERLAGLEIRERLKGAALGAPWRCLAARQRGCAGPNRTPGS